MMHKKFLLSALALFSLNAWAQTSYIDLSHDYSKATQNWPTSTPFKVTKSIAGSEYGFYCAVRDFCTNEHAGTHIDAPNHFAKGHAGVSDIPLTHLIGPAIKIDVTKEVKNNPDYLVQIKDFQAWETEHGKIPADTIILLSTGFGKHWSNADLYMGTKKKGADSLAQLHFPGLDPKAATWLVEERKLKAIGIDTFSIDYGQTKKFESHQILTKNNIPVFENVASMEQIPETDFVIYALPMKIKDGTGAPLRIVAEVK